MERGIVRGEFVTKLGMRVTSGERELEFRLVHRPSLGRGELDTFRDVKLQRRREHERMPVRLQSGVRLGLNDLRTQLRRTCHRYLQFEILRHRNAHQNTPLTNERQGRIQLLLSSPARRKPSRVIHVFVQQRGGHPHFGFERKRLVLNELHVQRRLDVAVMRGEHENVRLCGEAGRRNELEYGVELFANVERKPFELASVRYRNRVQRDVEHVVMPLRLRLMIRMGRLDVLSDPERALLSGIMTIHLRTTVHGALFGLNPFAGYRNRAVELDLPMNLRGKQRLM